MSFEVRCTYCNGIWEYEWSNLLENVNCNYCNKTINLGEKQEKCPSCSAPVTFNQKEANIISCDYCSTILNFSHWELKEIWNIWEFINFPSPIAVWKPYSFNGIKYNVKGEIRYEYLWGFFNKYMLEKDGRYYYLSEDDRIYKLTKESEWKKLSTPFNVPKVGTKVTYKNKEFTIIETGELNVWGIKWSIINTILPWKKYYYIDMLNSWEYFGLELDEEKMYVREINEIKKGD